MKKKVRETTSINFIRTIAPLFILLFLYLLTGCRHHTSESAQDTSVKYETETGAESVNNAVPSSEADDPGAFSYSEFRAAAVLPSGKIRATSFFEGIWDGIHDGEKATGLILSEYSPDENSTISSTLKIALYAQVDGIILFPSQSSNSDLLDLIAEARKTGTKFVIIDTAVPDYYYDVFIGIDNTEAGEQLADYLLEHVTDGEQVLVLEPEASDAVKARKEAFYSVITDASPDVTLSPLVLKDQDTNEERLSSIQAAVENQEGLHWIVSFDPSCTNQAAETLLRLNLASEISLIGFGESETMKEYVNKDAVDALLVQDNYSMGMVAVEKLADLLEGKKPDSKNYYVNTSMLTAKGDSQ